MKFFKWIMGVKPTPPAIALGLFALAIDVAYSLFSRVWSDLFTDLFGPNPTVLANVLYFISLVVGYPAQLYLIALGKGVLNNRGHSKLDWYFIMSATFKVIALFYFCVASQAAIRGQKAALELAAAGAFYKQMFSVILAITGIYALIQFYSLQDDFLGLKRWLLAAVVLVGLAGMQGRSLSQVFVVLASAIFFVFLVRLMRQKVTVPPPLPVSV